MAVASQNIAEGTHSKSATSNYTSVSLLLPFPPKKTHLTLPKSERNHNIRIPGFASDEARISLSQAAIAPAAGAAGTTKKGAQNAQMTLRSHRLSQVQFAKKEAKLM